MGGGGSTRAAHQRTPFSPKHPPNLTGSPLCCRYVVGGAALADGSTSVPHYTLKDTGTAWLDALVVAQLNDCPSNASHGFSDMQLPPFVGSTASNLTNASRCCAAGWQAGVDFTELCRATPDWFWFCPNTGPCACCKATP